MRHRIARANVHLMPSPAVPTTETGTRHRTAERLARSLDVPVISVSAAMGLVTVYRHHERHVLQPVSRLHERVSQALQTLQRFRRRFNGAVAALSALEIGDTVTLRDVAAVLQPAELAVRIADEIEHDLLELGDDGRLLRLQLEELTEGVRPLERLVVRDYVHAPTGGRPWAAAVASAGNGSFGPGPGRDVLRALGELTTDELLDGRRVAGALGLPPTRTELDVSLEPRGYRLLHRLPRFPEVVVDRIVEHFDGLQQIMRASVADLEEVDGVGDTRARSVKEGLARLAGKASILDPLQLEVTAAIRAPAGSLRADDRLHLRGETATGKRHRHHPSAVDAVGETGRGSGSGRIRYNGRSISPRGLGAGTLSLRRAVQAMTVTTFDIGDKVVYPHHGAAIVERREVKEAFGEKKEYLVLRLAYGDLTLMVPADNTEGVGLREVINDEEVEEVFAVLRKKEARMPTNWSRRYKNHSEKLRSGDIYQVAEVVRNLSIRDKDKGLSAGEKRMLSRARQILVSELTFALDVNEEQAEVRLDEALP